MIQIDFAASSTFVIKKEMEKETSKPTRSREELPDVGFKIMTFLMWMADTFVNHSARKFRSLGLQPGQVVVDYGCGPARYVKPASEAVGETGRVIATDIHPKAMEAVNAKISRYSLKNVETAKAEGYSTPIPAQTADVVYALDMFHMIEQPAELLKELHRILKPNGILILEDGHQPRSKTMKKVKDFGKFKIVETNRKHLICKPIK